MAASFSSIPILDWSLLSNSEGHTKFVEQLRYALINVGFLYLSNPPVDREDMDALIQYTPRLFDLPQEDKERIIMANSPHFFGYSRLGAELTKGLTDQREQFDFGTPYENQWKPGDPEYLKLWGPPQVWPSCSSTTRDSLTALTVAFRRFTSWFQGDIHAISKPGRATQLRIYRVNCGSLRSL